MPNVRPVAFLIGETELRNGSVGYLEMFHENSDDDVDENKLRHQDENDEEDRSNDWTDAAVVHAIVRVITVVS